MKLSLLVFIFGISCVYRPHQRHLHGDANEHMHKSDHAQLIEQFNDSARDKWQRPRRVLELISPLNNMKLIDIGAGSGYFTKYFLEAKATVVAADVDKKFLGHLEKSFPNDKYPGLSFSHIPYDDPKMADSSFDIAFTSNTYHHINNRIDYLKKVKSGLKMGGRFVVVDFKPDGKGDQLIGPPLKLRLPVSSVISELMEAGFEELLIYLGELDHQYIIIGKRTN